MGTTSADTLLARYIECTDKHESEALIEALAVEHAQPSIRKIVRYKLGFQAGSETQDIEDVSGEVMVELLTRLQAMKEGAAGGIESFSAYTAVAAYHACNEYLRRKYPNRHRLKNRLRYLLNNEKKLALWETSGDWICGLSQWRLTGTAPAPSDRVSRWRELLHDLPHGPSSSHPADLLAAVFERLRGPVEFDELVEIMAWLWGVEDVVAVPESSAREVESADAGVAQRLELTQWLARLWAEIRELPQAQRTALLLNLRSDPGGPAVHLLPITGTAGIPEIADALGLTPEELAEIWNSLPLEDLAVAARMGLTRQQVINLRKSARERLSRRVGSKYLLPKVSNMGPKLPSNQVTR